MQSRLRNILAFVLGFVAGSAVNGILIAVGGSVIPPPDGVDASTMESLAEGIHLFGPKHFLFPFMAHALGTLTGTLLGYKIASGKKELIAWILGGFFLAGGVAASLIIPAPLWFIAVDLAFAYLPMAWLAILLSRSATVDENAA